MRQVVGSDEARLRTISNIYGWALNEAVELDRHVPGFAGAFLRASDERRQTIAAHLAAQPLEGDPAELRDRATFLLGSSHRSILFDAFGDVPTGMRGALRRSGPQPHPKRFYAYLHRLLSDPPSKQVLTTLRQLGSIDLIRLRIIRRLPSKACTASLVEAVATAERAADFATLLQLLIENGVEEEALFEAARRVTSTGKLISLCERWARKTVFPPHPVPASPSYLPVRDGEELRQLARRYHNCAERYVAAILEGRDALAEITMDGRGVVIHLVHQGGAWRLQDLFGKHNRKPDPDLRSAAIAYLRQHDVHEKAPSNDSGQWAALRRLTSRFLFDLEDED